MITAYWIPLVVFLAQALAQQPTATLQGRVTDGSGKPVRKVTVLLSNGAVQPYIATTAADGAYSFARIEPGRYLLRTQRSGYLPASLGAPNWHSLGPWLTIAAGQSLTNVDFTLISAGSISGTVRDADGDPVSGVSVRVWQRDYQDEIPRLRQGGTSPRPAVTDNAGRYKLEDLAPGTYFVSASSSNAAQTTALFEIVGLSLTSQSTLQLPARPGQPAEAYLTTWYPHAADSNAASQLEVVAGGDTSGTDIQLRETAVYRVRGSLAGGDGAHEWDRFSVTARTIDGGLLLPAGMLARAAKDGSFELNGLPPGNYYLRAATVGPADPGQLALGKVTIVDKDIDGVVLSLQRLIELRGILTTEQLPGSRTPGGPVTIALVDANTTQPDGPQAIGGQTTIGRDGSFAIPRILPGSYRVRITPSPGKYLKSVLLGDVEVGQSEFKIDSNSPVMQVTLGRATGTIVADAQPGPQGEVANYLVVAPIGDTLSSPVRRMQYGRADDGQFIVSGLPPGAYRLYAMTDPLDSERPADLTAYESQSVTVSVNGTDPAHATLRTIARR